MQGLKEGRGRRQEQAEEVGGRQRQPPLPPKAAEGRGRWLQQEEAGAERGRSRQRQEARAGRGRRQEQAGGRWQE
jgi:hypothetical protein